jgi:hypothetical protein
VKRRNNGFDADFMKVRPQFEDPSLSFTDRPLPVSAALNQARRNGDHHDADVARLWSFSHEDGNTLCLDARIDFAE